VRFLWASLVCLGVLAIDSSARLDSAWVWAVGIVLIVFGLLRLTAKETVLREKRRP
jgi:hypothetical protein